MLENYSNKLFNLKVIKAFYTNSRQCCKIKRKEGEWFEVGVGLSQDCAMFHGFIISL